MPLIKDAERRMDVVVGLIFTLALLVFIATSGSPGVHVWDNYATPADKRVVTEAIEALRVGDEQKLVDLSVPEVRSRVPKAVREMRRNLTRDPGATISLINASYVQNLTRGVDHLTTDFELRGRREQHQVRVVLTHRDGSSLISALKVGSLSSPLARAGSLALPFGSPLQILSVILTALTGGAILAAFVTLIRARSLRRRWLWALGCLFGLGRCSTDWATDQISVSPLFVQTFAIQVFRTGEVGPLITSWSLPLVALIVLWKYRRLPVMRREGSPVIAT